MFYHVVHFERLTAVAIMLIILMFKLLRVHEIEFLNHMHSMN